MKRLVLLGASNVRRGLPVVVRTAREAWPDLEIFGAFGHGRSYGARSRFLLVRDLPGIMECGIWDALAADGGDVSAVVTDVGNDVLYGRDAPTILGWVGECLARLRAAGARLRVAGLPLDRIRRVSRAEFLLFRTLFFPGSRVAWRDAIETSERLDAGLRRLAADSEAAFVVPDAEWFDGDPIHIRRSSRSRAWAAILGLPERARPMRPGNALRLLSARPEIWWVAGIERRRRQPAYAEEGLRLSLY